MSELIHTIMNCGNQTLFLIGLRDAVNDDKYMFWALVLALVIFFFGAGVISQATQEASCLRTIVSVGILGALVGVGFVCC